MTTIKTLDDVILNDGDIAAQTSASQIHSNITIDAATLRDKGPRKSFNRSRGERAPRTEGARSRDQRSDHKSPQQEATVVKQTPLSFKIKPGEKPVKIGSLMGLEQVGQCIFIEYEDDIIIVDAGMEFAAHETMGADYIIPDIRYIKQNIHKLRGIVLSHGHLDHVGALRDLLPDLDFPTIYTTPLTLGIVQKTFDNKQDIQKIKYKLVNPDTEILKLGCFSIEFVRVNHNIPETYAMSIQTPKGIIFNSSDFKFDHTPAIGEPADLAKIARIGMEWVKLFIGDSLWCTKKWWAPSEKEVGENLENIVKSTQGRLIVATFASNVGRVIQLVNSAIKYNRVVFLSGRSMENYTAICQQLWYINAPKDMIRKLTDDVENMPDNRVLILCTGAQGEEYSALARMARGEHAQIRLRTGDTVLKSASVIPGNELQSEKMLNDLVVRWINIITNDDMDIHASGHGGSEDHKLMLTLVKPDYFLPYYIQAYFRYEYRKIWLSMGIADDHILMPNENGTIIELYDDGCKLADQKLKLDVVMIDGKGRGHLAGEFVVKARKIMAESGLVNLIFKIDSITKNLVGNIQIESRWFVYSGEVRKIHTDIVKLAEKMYTQGIKRNTDIKYILKDIRTEIESYCKRALDRVPMVVPMYIYINDNKGEIQDSMPEEDAYVGTTLDDVESEGIRDDVEREIIG